jgi:ParB family transcriptional regulator, chromosome partitioning protein
MSGEPRPRGLGRGLSALLGDDDEDLAKLDRIRAPRTVAVDQLRPGRFQPRRQIAEDDLADLARSVAEQGILQPILVRRDPDEPRRFEIIAGERRWRAAQRAGLHDVPVVVRELDDRTAMAIALVENLQRQDLSALEEAEGYRRLLDDFGNTQEQVAERVGKSRSHVANSLRLLTLPDSVKALLDSGELSPGHARALVGREDAETLARMVASRGLNVRQTEQLMAAQRGVYPAQPKNSGSSGKDADTRALERDLGALLGLAVEVRFKGNGGTLVLHYRSLEQLDDVLHRLRRPRPDGTAE